MCENGAKEGWCIEMTHPGMTYHLGASGDQLPYVFRSREDAEHTNETTWSEGVTSRIVPCLYHEVVIINPTDPGDAIRQALPTTEMPGAVR